MGSWAHPFKPTLQCMRLHKAGTFRTTTAVVHPSQGVCLLQSFLHAALQLCQGTGSSFWAAQSQLRGL